MQHGGVPQMLFQLDLGGLNVDGVCVEILLEAVVRGGPRSSVHDVGDRKRGPPAAPCATT